MKIALYSLPRSRSDLLFNYLAPLAKTLGMDVYRPSRGGEYYYLKNELILSNTFLKIDTRTSEILLDKIITQLSDHCWFITTRDFEDFCLSLTYAIKNKKFQHISKDYTHTPFTISFDDYLYARDLYIKHLQYIEKIKSIVHNASIIDYNNNFLTSNDTVHIEKKYKELCMNYAEFRDWQRVDYIINQNKLRNWNCWSSFQLFDQRTDNLYAHELFNDIVLAEDCYMWYNIYDKGDSQDWHCHPGNDLCGTRFLQIPNNSGLFELKNIYVDNKQHTQIEFMPHELHRVTTHNSNIPRITVSWNIKYK